MTGAEVPQQPGAARQGLRTVSLQHRVTVAALAVMAGLVLVLGAFVDITLQRRLASDLRSRLLRDIAAVRPIATQPDARAALRALERQGIGTTVTRPDGAQVIATGPQPDPVVLSRILAAASRGGSPVVGEGGGSLSVARVMPSGLAVTLTADAAFIDRTVRQVRLLTLVGGGLVLAVGGLVLTRVVRVALAPLDTITGLARAITEGDRGARLAPDRTDTELGRTAAAFDDMLDALEGAENTARAAEAQARAAEARMRDFLSDAAHELRTPVAGLRAAAETVLRETSVDHVSGPPADRERLAVAMVREAERAGRLVDDLLAMARIDRGLALELTQVRLADVAAEQIARQRLLAPHLHVELDGSAPPVLADASRISQILANLLDNARRAVDGRGRVAVRLGAESGSAAGSAAGGVTSSLTGSHTGMATVDVLDDGPGIPQADRERVFERFVRLDASRASRSGGAGLGLPIARGLARAHGGDLVALPAPAGAWLRLSLPMEGPPPG